MPLEDHREGCLSRQGAPRLSRAQPHRGKGRLHWIGRPNRHPVLGRKVIKAQQHVAVFVQAVHCLGILRPIGRYEVIKPMFKGS